MRGTKSTRKKLRILYAIQGTGNGHISRAIEIVPHLKKKASVDLLISGIQSELELPFDVKYRFKGLGFIFGKNGGVDLFRTFVRNKSKRFLKEIKSLDVRQYDLVVSDFEPVSAWAARLRQIPCVALSNQVAVFSPEAPRPKKKDPLGKFILKNYAPADAAYGFNYIPFSERVYTPVIRSEIRKAKVRDKGFYVVYLPAHSDKRIIKQLEHFPSFEWQVFSKTYKKEPKRFNNVLLRRIDPGEFMQSLADCSGVITAAGFGTTSETLFLGKKLLVLPMKAQYEQQCNAAMLKSMGIPILQKLDKKNRSIIEGWINNGMPAAVSYNDQCEEIIDTILNDFREGRIAAGKKKNLPLKFLKNS